MTATPLYRSEVLDAKRNRWLGGLILRQPFSHWAATWVAIGAFAIVVAFLCVGQYARKVRLDGRVVAPSTAAPDAAGRSGGSQAALLEVALIVPERVLGSTAVGQDVLLRYPAFPHQRYGHYRGRIVGIAREPVAAATPAAPSAYRATVALERQSVRDDDGAERGLRPGLSVQADVVVERHRLYQWLFKPFVRLRERHGL